MVVLNGRMTTLVDRRNHYEGVCRQGLLQGDHMTRDARGCTITNWTLLLGEGGAVAYPQGVEVGSAGSHQGSG